MLPAGETATKYLATGDVDIRTDLPAYNVYRDGILADTVHDITSLWQKVRVISDRASFHDVVSLMITSPDSDAGLCDVLTGLFVLVRSCAAGGNLGSAANLSNR